MLKLKYLLKASVLIFMATLSITSVAQIKTLPKEELSRQELSPEISRDIKDALKKASGGCGLESAHGEHDHDIDIRRALLNRDGSLTSDSVRKLIFTQGELTTHQMQTLIAAIGDMNATDTDALLRTIYQHAPTIAKRFVDPDIEERDMQNLVLNSNIEDIRASVMQALSKSRDHKLHDLVEKSAQQEGYVASIAKEILKNKAR